MNRSVTRTFENTDVAELIWGRAVAADIHGEGADSLRVIPVGLLLKNLCRGRVLGDDERVAGYHDVKGLVLEVWDVRHEEGRRCVEEELRKIQ